MTVLAVNIVQAGTQVVAHSWGEDAAALLPAPDLITGADIVYQSHHFAVLIRTLQDLCAPHTIAYLAFKLRGDLSSWTRPPTVCIFSQIFRPIVGPSAHMIADPEAQTAP